MQASCNISVPTHLLAAGSAAAVSAVAVQPLGMLLYIIHTFFSIINTLTSDVLKTRLQTNVALRQNLFGMLFLQHHITLYYH